jgi:hypothetical protein
MKADAKIAISLAANEITSWTPARAFRAPFMLAEVLLMTYLFEYFSFSEAGHGFNTHLVVIYLQFK